MKPKLKEALLTIQHFIADNGRSPSLREIKEKMGYKSPRSTFLLVNQLIQEGFLRRNGDELQVLKPLQEEKLSASTIRVPLIGRIACGTPVLAEENIEDEIPVTTRIARPPYRYFFLRAQGDSMNKRGIQDGDLVLVKQQTVAESGQSVVALIDDEATIKEYCLENGLIILKPHSTSSAHKPIILDEDFQIQGVVVTSFSNL